MDSSDDDIEFDFFDEEPATAEKAHAPRVRLPQRGGRGPRTPRGPSRPAAPLVRLLALVFFVVFLVLVFALLIQSCAGESRHSRYSKYMNKVITIAGQSTNDGKQTVSALTTPGLSVPAMVQKLHSIAAQEQQNVQSAESLSPPGRLRTEHANLIEALELRVSGVNGLAAAFQKTIGQKTKTDDEAAVLSDQAYRLLASDVVWDDLFRTPVQTQLDHDGISGVNPPESHFLASPDLIITQHAMGLVLDRISGTSGSTGTTSGILII